MAKGGRSVRRKDREDCEMQKPKTVLEVIQKRGEEGKPLERVYRQLFNYEMYELAYSKIYANSGATTKGTGKETLDGMSKDRIEGIIQKIKTETYRWRPVRRVYIPKENGKERPLGIPSGDDKLLQAVMKSLLEAYYEPKFSVRSHGFRPGRGCHTALIQIAQKHKNTSWFIEGDIKGCFDNINQEKLVKIVEEHIKDKRFTRLLTNLMKAGYTEDWKVHETRSGTPQGGIISPLLANIYLDKLDKWVEKSLLPEYNRSSEKAEGNGRRRNPEYLKLHMQQSYRKRKGEPETARKLRQEMRKLPSIMTKDEEHRKLEYIRYADDFLLSFNGPKKEAEEIKEKIREFLAEELKLELSKEKTLITHARTQKARFLGYDLKVMQSKHRRTVNGHIYMGIPREVVRKAMRKDSKNGKPIQRAGLVMNSDYDIIHTLQAEYRGIVQYYIMAHNLGNLRRVRHKMITTLLKTLANKHKISVNKVVKKYKGTKIVDGKSYKVMQVTVKRKGKKDMSAHFGAIPLIRNPMPSKITDKTLTLKSNTSEKIDRASKDECDMCGAKGRIHKIERHHVRKLKDLKRPGRKEKPVWVWRMAAINRKVLFTCKSCHVAIHAGKHKVEWNKWNDTLESRVQ